HETSDHWLVIESTTKCERRFTPPVTRAELGERYPGAALVALLNAAGELGATAEQEAELRRLGALVAKAKGFTEVEGAEAVANAVRRPGEALTSLHAMMREHGIA